MTKSNFKTLPTNDKDSHETFHDLIQSIREGNDVFPIEKIRKRVAINDDIRIVEPLIKNPRMRVQEGLFMFFPIVSTNGINLLSLENYIKEYRKLSDAYNEKNKDNQITHKFFLSKEVCKDHKESILKELKETYGISKESLFVDSKFTKGIEEQYSNIHSYANGKVQEMRKSLAL